MAARSNGWLLDTHALLWMVYGDRRLSKAARAIMNSTEPLFHSAASFWEIALKRAGKGFDFEIEDQWDRVLTAELHRIGVRRLDIEAADCRALEDLPPHHRDPFDRMLVAQAMRRNLGLLSRDTLLDAYAVPRAW